MLVVAFPPTHPATDGVGRVLVLIHSFNSERRHANVDWDDCLFPVCQRERGFTGRDALGGPVGPEHSGEFLCPFAFNFIQTFALAVEDGAVAYLSLTIALRIVRRGESMGNLVLGAEATYLFAGKIRSVVGDGVGGSDTLWSARGTWRYVAQ